MVTKEEKVVKPEKVKNTSEEKIEPKPTQNEEITTEKLDETKDKPPNETKEDVEPEKVKIISDDKIETKPVQNEEITTKKPEKTKEEIKEVVEDDQIEESAGENFEQMLEDTLVNIKQLEIGDKVAGEIINITDSYIFVTLGGKRDVYAEKQDYFDKSGELTCKVGDTLEGYIVKDTETETLIAKSLVSVNLNILHDAFEEKIPVNGKVQSMTKGGYIIDISGIKAFCPISHIDDKIVVEPKKFMNGNYDFRIIDYKDKGRNIVVSRKKILETEKKKLRKEILKELELGTIVDGVVTRLTNFGAFIDIGGIDGLLHISQFSWGHIDSPSEILNIGDEIKAKVIKIKGDKISLSMKALQENPVEATLRELTEGETLTCKVVRNLSFGSFVEIKPGVEGLIPISELSRGRRINNPSEVVQEGDIVEAQILKINLDNQKISLSLKALQPDPWDVISENINENDIVTGVIENVVNFGAFIKISDGLTGLLPASKLKIAQVTLDSKNVGEEYKVRVVKIDKAARRISLEPTNMPESAKDDKNSWHKYKKESKQPDHVSEDNPFANL
ncbi:MAG: S1 RNA-binding domain-containing protein [Candidatus Cloacimonetes bacterium]|jgi:small subunit ribosomal protein S1|nr:S1 RNA-binding domain-containing protein [Candidatus Cloacimonadota bacterium]